MHGHEYNNNKKRTRVAELCLICEIFIHFYGDIFNFPLEGNKPKSQIDEETESESSLGYIHFWLVGHPEGNDMCAAGMMNWVCLSHHYIVLFYGPQYL